MATYKVRACACASPVNSRLTACSRAQRLVEFYKRGELSFRNVVTFNMVSAWRRAC